jgi:hypothetical protein
MNSDTYGINIDKKYETDDKNEINESSNKNNYYEINQKSYEMTKDQIPKYCKIKRSIINNVHESISNEPLYIFKDDLVSFSFDKDTNDIKFHLNDFHGEKISVNKYTDLSDIPFDEGILYYYLEKKLYNINNYNEFLNFLENQKIVSVCPFEYKSFLIACIENRFYEMKFKFSPDNHYIQGVPLNE